MKWDAGSFTGDRLYLDTNVLITAIEQGNPWTDEFKELFESIDERAIHAVTSELMLEEALTKPLALGASDLVQTYETLLAPGSVMKVIPVDRTVLRAAADLAGRIEIKLADAIHVATAIQSSCDLFITNDERLGRKILAPGRWLNLADLFDPEPKPSS